MTKSVADIVRENITIEDLDEIIAASAIACRTCLYWTGDRVLNFELPGNCRRNAPVAAMHAEGRYEAEQPRWPRVTHTDWCGDYETAE